MRWFRPILPITMALSLSFASQAFTEEEENAEDFMGIHKIEITFHQAGTTKNLNLMMSLFADDATLTSGGKTYRIKYAVEGDKARLYFECLYVDKAKNNIAAHTNSDDTLIRVEGKWLIKDMKASSVPEL